MTNRLHAARENSTGAAKDGCFDHNLPRHEVQRLQSGFLAFTIPLTDYGVAPIESFCVGIGYGIPGEHVITRVMWRE